MNINDTRSSPSDPVNVKFGEPQESTLEPILFNICVNDLCNSNLADDPALLFEGKNWK